MKSHTPYDLQRSNGKDTFGLLNQKQVRDVVKPNAATSDQGRTFYSKKGLTVPITIHETLHRVNPGVSDKDLAAKLGISEADYNQSITDGKGSEIIDDELAKHGCK